MTQYELICNVEDCIEQMIDNESNSNFDDEGLETLQTIQYLVKKYVEINDKREI